MNKTIVMVTFNSTRRGDTTWMKEYAFFTTLKLKVDDVVVVDCATGIQCCTVTQIGVLRQLASKWVVQKVTLKTHNARMKKVERADELRARLKEKLNLWKEDEAYRVMANTDAEAKRLMNELKELGV